MRYGHPNEREHPAAHQRSAGGRNQPTKHQTRPHQEGQNCSQDRTSQSWRDRSQHRPHSTHTDAPSNAHAMDPNSRKSTEHSGAQSRWRSELNRIRDSNVNPPPTGKGQRSSPGMTFNYERKHGNSKGRQAQHLHHFPEHPRYKPK